jgi:hypothetical protein
MRLEVVKHEEAKRAFVLLPRGWVCGARFRLGIAVSAVGEGLREATHHFGGVALRRVCLPLPTSGNRHSRRGSITRSRHLDLEPLHSVWIYQEVPPERIVRDLAQVLSCIIVLEQ